MVEFSKILKKFRGLDADASRQEEPLPKPHREHAVRPEPRPRQEESPREPAAPDIGEDAAELKEEASFKPVKPLFSQHRVQASIEAAADAALHQVPAFQDEKERISFPQPAAAAEEPLPPAEAEPGHSLALSEAQTLYNRMMDAIRHLLDESAEPQQLDIRVLTPLLSEAIAAIGLGDERLIEYAVTYLLKDESSYLPQHSVNVAILSLMIGHGVGYDTDKMMELGLTAFLHDIGMVACRDLASVPRPLTAKEFEKIKQHVDAGQKILREIAPSVSEAVLAAQYEIHERLDGSGYPKGRRSLHEYAKIIALVDSFESMIHPRPFRPRSSIMEVYKNIFAAKQKYDPIFIKVLVDRLGFFPNGSFIQLNTKEVGRVIAQNPRSPLRPVVQILFNESGKRLDDVDVMDVSLVKYPTLHVAKCFLEEAASVADSHVL